MVHLNISIYEGTGGKIYYEIEPTVNEASSEKERPVRHMDCIEIFGGGNEN